MLAGLTFIKYLRYIPMRKAFPLIFVSVLSLIFLSRNSIVAVEAQGPRSWSPVDQVPGYLNDTLTPYLLADQNQTVHAFASQWVGNEDKQLAIVYCKWSLDGSWTTPVDIILPSEGGARPIGAFLDQTGMMHLAYWDGEGQVAKIFYTRAPLMDVGRAPAWSAPKQVGDGPNSPASGAIDGDESGHLTIIYSGYFAGYGVYEVHSFDAGDNWSTPAPIFLTEDPNFIPYGLHTSMDSTGHLHAVWNVVTSTGVDESIYYARLDMNTQQWSEPIVLDTRIKNEAFFGPSFPTIVANGENLVVMYNSGNPVAGGHVPIGRPIQRVMFSRDGGNTWSMPTSPFPRLTGRSGGFSMVEDSAGVVHALFIQRIEQNIQGRYSSIAGIWHSELRDSRWSEPERIDLGKLSGHDVQAVVSQGNVLLVAFREDPGVGELGIFYSYTGLNAPELPVMPVSAMPVAATFTPEPITTPATITSGLTTPANLGSDNYPLTDDINDPNKPIILAIIPTILLLAVVITIKRTSLFRHK